MSGTGGYGGVDRGVGGEEVPENYRAIAQLVAGYVDDRLAEFRHEVAEVLGEHAHAISGLDKHTSTIQATMGGLRDAVADLQQAAGESMPEHVYKNFIRSEAERLRIVKRTVRENG